MRDLLVLAMIPLMVNCGGNGSSTEDAADESDVVEDSGSDTPDVTEEDVVEEPDGACTSNGDCDDSDPCSSDTCNDLGECEHDDLDEDSDGYIAAMGTDGVTDCGGDDCDDDDDSIHPGATIACSATDDLDCNGHFDADNDGDGYDAGEDEGRDCGGDDCNDDDEIYHPGATIACSDVDDLDCNGNADIDNDDDGHDDGDVGGRNCGGDDCDDDDAATYPDADEVCADGVDQDCDTLVDGLTLMRETPTFVSFADSSGGDPSLAWTGSEYGIVYHTPAGAGDGAEVKAWSLNGEGGLLSTGDPYHTDGPNGDHDGDLVWTGSEYFLGFEKNMVPGGGGSVHLVNIAEDWTPLGSELEIGPSGDVSMVWTGSELGLCWRSSGIVCNAFDASATPRWSSDTVFTPVDATYRAVDLAWSGSEYAMVWESEADMGGATTSYLTMMSVDGVVVGSTLELDTGLGNNSLQPRLVWAASQWAVTWLETTDFSAVDSYLVYVDAATGAAGTPVAVSAAVGDSGMPIPVWTGSETLVSWMDVSGGFIALRIRARTFDGTGIPTSDEIEVPAIALSAANATLVATSSEVGIAWEEMSTTSVDVFFTRLGFCD